MKTNKKLKLHEISVNSFMTNEGKLSNNGGYIPEDIGEYITPYGVKITWNISEALVTEEFRCGYQTLIYTVSQLAPETAGILTSIIESAQNMNCAGATRAIVQCTRAGDLC